MRYVSFGALFCQYDDLIHLRRKAEYKARGGACADRGRAPAAYSASSGVGPRPSDSTFDGAAPA